MRKRYKLEESLAGTLKWKFKTGGDVDSSPAIGNDGTIYVGSCDNYLYAIYSDSTSPADSPRPMFRHDLQHTGNAESIIKIKTQNPKNRKDSIKSFKAKENTIDEDSEAKSLNGM